MVPGTVRKVEALEKARSKGLGLIQFRPRSENELRQRLLRSGTNPANVEKLLAEFKRKGLLDDTRFSTYFATGRMMEKPEGRRLLLSRLKAKGVDQAVAGRAVEAAMEGRSELDLARELGVARLGRFKGLNPPVRQRRLFGFLSRRGFASDIVYQVVRELRAGQP